MEIRQSQIRHHLKSKVMANEIICLTEVDSTNEYFKRNVEHYPHGSIVVADRQTMGKGSKGRSWDSPDADGVWMSLLLKPVFPVHKTPMLTLVMAVSVARACRQLYGLPAFIKWPNDIVCSGKKLGGILTELKTNVDGTYAVIVGLGINTNTEQFSDEIQEKATSVLLEAGKRVEREALIGAVMNCFEEDYEIFLQTEDLSGLLEVYQKLSVTIGQPVKVLDIKGEYEAFAIDVNKEGHLLVEKEDNSRSYIFADEVSVRGIYGYVPESAGCDVRKN